MNRLPVFLSQGYLLLCLLLLGIAASILFFRTSGGETITYTFETNPETREKREFSLFIFDPNTIDSAQLDSLQLPYWVKRNLLRYRAKGGGFNTASDIKKLYGMTDSIFEQVRPFISIKKKTFAKKQKRYAYKKWPKQVYKKKQAQEPIELNNATEDELKIRGIIGKYRAQAIIKYRNYLGGFYSAEQLKEVYSLPDSLIDTLRHFYTVDTSCIKKKQLRSATWKNLLSHKFVSKYHAKHILQALRTDTSLTQTAQLLDNHIIDTAVYQKLKLYFH